MNLQAIVINRSPRGSFLNATTEVAQTSQSLPGLLCAAAADGLTIHAGGWVRGYDCENPGRTVAGLLDESGRLLYGATQAQATAFHASAAAR